MNCFNCGVSIRQATIICPVCNSVQFSNRFGRLIDSLKQTMNRRVLHRRSHLLIR